MRGTLRRVGSGRGWGEPRCDKIFGMNFEETHKFVDSVVQIAELFDQLARGMQQNRRTWEASERATEGQLIDPVLQLLGWDPMNADDVGLQVKCSSGIADYVLRVDEKPIAVLEAKKLGTRIDTDVRWQASGYAEALSAPLLILTNGDRWEIYDSSNRRSKPAGAWTISRDKTFRSALEAVKVSKDVMVATFGSRITPDHETRPEPTPTESPDPAGITQAPESDWTPLSGFVQTRGKSEGTRKRIPKPRGIRFPGRQPVDVSRWGDIWIHWGSWLSEEIRDLVRWEGIDDTLQGRVRTLSKRIRPDTSGFRGKAYQLPNGWFIDMGIAGQRDMWLAIDYSSKYFGVDLNDVHVRF